MYNNSVIKKVIAELLKAGGSNWYMSNVFAMPGCWHQPWSVAHPFKPKPTLHYWFKSFNPEIHFSGTILNWGEVSIFNFLVKRPFIQVPTCLVCSQWFFIAWQVMLHLPEAAGAWLGRQWKTTDQGLGY